MTVKWVAGMTSSVTNKIWCIIDWLRLNHMRTFALFSWGDRGRFINVQVLVIYFVNQVCRLFVLCLTMYWMWCIRLSTTLASVFRYFERVWYQMALIFENNVNKYRSYFVLSRGVCLIQELRQKTWTSSISCMVWSDTFFQSTWHVRQPNAAIYLVFEIVTWQKGGMYF